MRKGLLRDAGAERPAWLAMPSTWADRASRSAVARVPGTRSAVTAD